MRKSHAGWMTMFLLLSRFRLPEVPMMVRGPINRMKVTDAQLLARLAIPEEVTRVESLPDGDAIEFIRSPGQITLTVLPFEVHAAVQFVTKQDSEP